MTPKIRYQTLINNNNSRSSNSSGSGAIIIKQLWKLKGHNLTSQHSSISGGAIIFQNCGN